MSLLRRNTNADNLHKVIDDNLTDLYGREPDDEMYDVVLTRVERLNKLKTANQSQGVSPDTIATILANLAGIAMIVEYERAAVVTSKAIGFVSKLR